MRLLFVGVFGCATAPDAGVPETGTPGVAWGPSPVATVRGPAAAGRAGIGVAGLGDRDGDGVLEWAVTASAVGDDRQGAAWIQSGMPPAEVSLDLDAADVRGQQTIERLGQAAAAVGDLDGDGGAELALGGIHLGEPTTMQGGVRVLWSSGAVTTLTGDGRMEHSGWVVTPAWGEAALLVGAPYRRTADDAVDDRGFPLATGRVYVVDDVQDGRLADRSRAVLTGSGSWAQFGAATLGADVDGDGIGDVVVGIPSGPDADGGLPRGRVAWFAGPVTTDRTVGEAEDVWEGAPGDHMGFSLAAGDLDGDGHGDLAFGAYKAGVAVDDAGSVVIIDGATGAYAGRLDGDRDQGLAGAAVVFRDTGGGTELLIGAPGVRVDGQRAGVVYRQRGAVEGTVPLGLDGALAAPGPRADFGLSLAEVGDLDGGGVAELLVGAPGLDGAGAALLFRGEDL